MTAKLFYDTLMGKESFKEAQVLDENGKVKFVSESGDMYCDLWLLISEMMFVNLDWTSEEEVPANLTLFGRDWYWDNEEA